MSAHTDTEIAREAWPTSPAHFRRFRDFTMAHPRLVGVKDQLIDAIEETVPGSLIFVLGPAGVGKTTLLLKAQQLLTAQMLPCLESDPGRLPFVSVEAIASATGNFNWRDHFSRLLRRMDEPLVDSKLSFDRFPAERNCRGQYTSAPRTAGMELQHGVEQALRYRHPVAVFVDEAQHLARMSSGRKLSDQLDVIKSIANRTATIHVLIGTYELLAFCNLSGQLSRRSVHIHFARYSAENLQDVQIFKNVVLTFQNELPLRVNFDLVGEWEFLYEGSVGCVGILKDWLMRAAIAANRRGEGIMTRKHLERTALSVSQCEKILIEAREGEARLSEGPESRTRLRTLMGLGATAEKAAPSCQGVQAGRSLRNWRPGQRLPKRDLVGQVSAIGVG